MAAIEIYINGKLCDYNDAFTIRLNKQFISPGELNTKNAQYSYSVSLPVTSNNVKIFGPIHIEEVGRKFSKIYDAEVYVNALRVFKGSFKISDISRDGYKGNFYIPAVVEVKDVFGSALFKDAPAYNIPFDAFTDSINQYNADAANEPQPAIFPYVLYGLLPKVPVNVTTKAYTSRVFWDSTVRLGINDFPPSINVVKLLQHLFTSYGYSLTGNVLTDSRFTEQYVSYKNNNEYVMPWNYADIGRVHISGVWSNIYNQNEADPVAERIYEKGVNNNTDVYGTNLFNSTNAKINVIEDRGSNFLKNTAVDNNGNTWYNSQLRIPISGYYKVQLYADVRVDGIANLRYTDPDTGTQFVGGWSEKVSNYFPDNAYEIHLLRDNNTGDFGDAAPKLMGLFYLDNQPQENPDARPLYYPQVDANGSQINFVDQAESSNLVLGLSVGREWRQRFGVFQSDSYMRNPKDTTNSYQQVLAGKSGQSWDPTASSAPYPAVIVNSPGYWKFGVLGSFDNEGDNPDGAIDYSTGTRVNNSTLNLDGQTVTATPAYIDWVVLEKFPLSAGYVYTIDAGTTAYSGNAYIFLDTASVAALVVSFTGGVAIIDTTPYMATGEVPKLSIQLVSDVFDVDGSLTIVREIPDGQGAAEGWELTNKYEIQLNNAPITRVRRGYKNNVPMPNDIADCQVEAAAVVWFEAGELISIEAVSGAGAYRRGGMHATYGYTSQWASFDLVIEPFQSRREWGKMTVTGRSSAAMDWNDAGDYQSGSIDLCKFMPIDARISEWVDNYCKTFNLSLYYENGSFVLNTKQAKKTNVNSYDDISHLANVNNATNAPLDLPSAYNLGFTIDTEEEGYFLTNDDGGGVYTTGAVGGSVVEQKSAFSYNWKKQLLKMPGNVPISVPVISSHEPWLNTNPYGEQMTRRFTDKTQRFWYYNGILDVSINIGGYAVNAAAVSNELPELNILNYKNESLTILDNFFNILVNADSYYTVIELYLPQDIYTRIDGIRKIRFNDDLYFVAELSAYDPTMRNKTTLKLIRKL